MRQPKQKQPLCRVLEYVDVDVDVDLCNKTHSTDALENRTLGSRGFS